MAIEERVGALLADRGLTLVTAESCTGGLLAHRITNVSGSSAYYLGGTVVYTAAASRAWMAGEIEVPPGMRGATETFAGYLATSVRLKLGATWGVGEAGAAGPANPYGDPAGHSWLAIDGPHATTHNVLTGVDDRRENMLAFTAATLALFLQVLTET
mgnify:CR=1 FL=1